MRYISNLNIKLNMISSDLMKGLLKPIILKLLDENDRMYGYEITQKVEMLTQGKVKLTYGALYPILHKLEVDGIVTTETELFNNRSRVYYKLTPAGFNSAKEKILELEEFISTIGMILKPNLGFKANLSVVETESNESSVRKILNVKKGNNFNLEQD